MCFRFITAGAALAVKTKSFTFFMNFLFQLLSASKYFMKNKKLLKALRKLLIKVSTSTEAFKVQVHKKSRTLKIQITT